MPKQSKVEVKDRRDRGLRLVLRGDGDRLLLAVLAGVSLDAQLQRGGGVARLEIRKFLRFLLSFNIGEVLTMFFGVLLAKVIGLRAEEHAVVLPLLATQLLWINLITDGPPALALGIDPADSRLMGRPPRPRGQGVLTARMWRGIVFVGLIMAAGTLFILDASLAGGMIEGEGDMRYAQTMAFTTLDVPTVQPFQCAVG